MQLYLHIKGSKCSHLGSADIRVKSDEFSRAILVNSHTLPWSRLISSHIN